MPDDKLIVALDFDDLRCASSLAYRLRDHVSCFKVGIEAWGDPKVKDLIEDLNRQGSRVFLDLKLHDIPETIERAVRKITSTYDIEMLTVLGYPKTIGAAVRGAEKRTQIIAVNVLTSDDDADLFAAGYTISVASLQGKRIDYAYALGATGVVCAAAEAKKMKSFTHGQLKIITPGMRLEADPTDDQKRISPPFEALQAGATHYVVGRPITTSKEPVIAAQRFLDNAAGRRAA